MIRAHFCMNDLTMDVEGHAGSQGAEQEFDLVCCAASVVAQTLLYNIEKWEETHSGVTRKDLIFDKGKIHLHLVAEDWARVPIKRMMKYALQGFEMLEEKYDKYITVSEE